MLKVVIAAVALCRAAVAAGSRDMVEVAKNALLTAVHDYCGYTPLKPEALLPTPNSYPSWNLLRDSVAGNTFVIPMLTAYEKQLVDDGQKINAIKAIRSRQTRSLAEAKFAVEFYQAARYFENAK